MCILYQKYLNLGLKLILSSISSLNLYVRVLKFTKVLNLHGTSNKNKVNKLSFEISLKFFF